MTNNTPFYLGAMLALTFGCNDPGPTTPAPSQKAPAQGPPAKVDLSANTPPGGATAQVTTAPGATVQVTLSPTKGDPVSGSATADDKGVAEVVFASLAEGGWSGEAQATAAGVAGKAAKIRRFRVKAPPLLQMQGVGEGDKASCVVSVAKPEYKQVRAPKAKPLVRADDGKVAITFRALGAKSITVGEEETPFADGAATVTVQLDPSAVTPTVKRQIEGGHDVRQTWPIAISGERAISGTLSCALAGGYQAQVNRFRAGEKITFPGDDQPDTTPGVVAIVSTKKGKKRVKMVVNAKPETPMHHFDGVALLTRESKTLSRKCSYQDRKTGKKAQRPTKRRDLKMEIFDRRTGKKVAEKTARGATPKCPKTTTRTRGAVVGKAPTIDVDWITRTAKAKLR